MKSIIRNIRHRKYLQDRYRTTTDWVGVFASLSSLVLFYCAIELIVKVTGDEGGTVSGMASLPYLFIGLLILLACAYVSALLVSGIFSVLMLAANKFTKKEAFRYTFIGVYPVHWYQSQYRFLGENKN